MLERRTFDDSGLKNVKTHLDCCKKLIHTSLKNFKESFRKNPNLSGKPQRAVTNRRRTGP